MDNNLEFDFAQSNSKLGLALSGGGFRAALFHLGVLANLAEKNILKHIEVISTVSGGSIIGALYYLHLKKLLEGKSDSYIKKEDYIEIIKSIEKDFIKGVQSDIRLEAFSNFKKNLKMTFKPFEYTRLNYLGELYEKHFYEQLLKKSDICMQDLFINPKSKELNLENKVPNIFINSTLLNNGGNWYFTPEEMGQFENGLKPIDYKNYKSNVYLRDVVASSSSVPGIFSPLKLQEQESYNKYSFRLVDGGVTDNLGIRALLSQQCTHYIVSDGSRQLDLITENRDYLLNKISILRRTNDILMDQLTMIQLDNLKKKNSVIHLHLRDNLDNPNINWGVNKERKLIQSDWNKTSIADIKSVEVMLQAGATNKEIYNHLDKLNNQEGLTDYHISKKVQDLLSKVRTDLNSFSDIEAYSLVMSGYAICRKHTTRYQTKSNGCFIFKEIEEYLKNPTDHLIDRLRHRSSKKAEKRKLDRIKLKKKEGYSIGKFFLSFIIIAILSYFVTILPPFVAKTALIIFSIFLGWGILMLLTPYYRLVPYYIIKNLLMLFWSLLISSFKRYRNDIFLKRGSFHYLKTNKESRERSS